jgi:probable addiction module antidote protein
MEEAQMNSRPYNEFLLEQLKDPSFAAEFLTAAAEDDEPVVFLSALRKVAEVQGMAAVAERAGIPRESLYRILSARGNPRWSSLAPVLRATGLRIEIRGD